MGGNLMTCIGIQYYKALKGFDPANPSQGGVRRVTQDERAALLEVRNVSVCTNQLDSERRQVGACFHQCCRQPQPIDSSLESHQLVFTKLRDGTYTVHDEIRHLLCEPCLKEVTKDDRIPGATTFMDAAGTLMV
jgi:hypothetical protein